MEDGIFWGYTKKQWKIFIILAFVNLIAGLVYSIPAPFYPKEAEAKGAKATAYGFVIGVYELVNFFASPLFGAYMDKLGPIRVFHFGVILAGIMTVAFGFLHFINGATMFIVLSFLIRIPQALGGAAIITSSVTIVTVEFSNAIATTFAAIETFFGVGFCIGPTIGAALYDVGDGKLGFPLPFISMGSLLLLAVPFAMVALWNHDFSHRLHHFDFDISDTHTKAGLVSLLRIPAIILYIFAVITTSMCIGFLAALLEPHLRQFHLTPLVLGLMYLLYGGVYAITAPLWGMLCDRVSQPKYIMLAGSLFSLTAWLFLGPAPFFPFPPMLWLTAVSLVIFGLGLGSIFVSSFILSLKAAKYNKFPDNLSTHAMVSGIWRAAVALGSFIGPSLAGVLFDIWGFQYESLVVITLQVILIITTIVFLIKENGTASPAARPVYLPPPPHVEDLDDERIPILSKEHPNFASFN